MKSKHIAESGILVAATLVILYTTSILPISTLSVLTLASCLIPISIIRTSIRNSVLVYISSSLLSFFILPIKMSIYYTLFFGIYGLIKYFIENLNKLTLEIILKVISFNILLGLIYFISINFLGNFTLKFPIYILWVIAQIAFLIYDYALTLIISVYLQKLHKQI